MFILEPGFQLVYSLDMTDPDQNCPESLELSPFDYVGRKLKEVPVILSWFLSMDRPTLMFAGDCRVFSLDLRMLSQVEGLILMAYNM